MNGIKPIRLSPITKRYIWGIEEWLLSGLHPGFEQTSLLIKRIVANDALSIQVHPNDAYAEDKEASCGKTEMWYVLDCDPEAFLYYGLKHQVSGNEFLKRIQNGTITEICNKVKVKKGDVFYIPAGLVHAIGKGITVLEVQQNSDITYRVYDYEREDINHCKRELHIKQAAEVAEFVPPLQGHRPMGVCHKRKEYEKTLLVQCPYFTVHHYCIKSDIRLKQKTKYMNIYVSDGMGEIRMENEIVPLNRGDCIFVPSKIKEIEIAGKVELLISEVPG